MNHFLECYLLDSYDEPLYFENTDEAAKCVSDFVGHPIEPNVKALNDYLEEYEDKDSWYRFLYLMRLWIGTD